MYIYIYIYIYFLFQLSANEQKNSAHLEILDNLRTSIHKSPSAYLNINPGFLICKAEQTNVDCVRR